VANAQYGLGSAVNEQEADSQLAALLDWAVVRGLGVVTEYVLDGETAWTGKHHGQLRQILDNARVLEPVEERVLSAAAVLPADLLFPR